MGCLPGGECGIRLIPAEAPPRHTGGGLTSNPLQSLCLHAPAKSVSEVVRGGSGWSGLRAR